MSFTGSSSEAFAREACTQLGVALAITGLAGFATPHFPGLDTGFAHATLLMTTGALGIVVGGMTRPDVAMGFAAAVGEVFLLLGILGFVVGEPVATPHADGPTSVLRLGALELGAFDHVLHLLIGAVFAGAAWIAWSRSERTRPHIAGTPTIHTHA